MKQNVSLTRAKSTSLNNGNFYYDDRDTFDKAMPFL